MKSITIFLCLFLGLNIFSQDITDPEELFEEGRYFFQREDYKEALYFFSQLTDIYPGNANYNFRVGECYLNIPGQEHKAAPHLEIAAKYIVPRKDYNNRIYEEKNAPLHALFFLGNAYRVAGRLDEALDVYNKFLNSPYFSNNYNLNVVEHEIQTCERAKFIKDSPIEVDFTNLGDKINTNYDEYNPVVSADGQTMAFIRGLKFYNAIYVTKKLDGKWQEPKNINMQILSDGDYYPTGINSDGTQLIFTRKVKDNSDIYVSKLNDSVWSKATKIGGKINSSFNETYAAFGSNDKTLLIVCDRKRNKDLYISKHSSKGWTKPKYLGKVINTDLDEDTPVMCNNGKTIVFSSKEHNNMGGLDIFYSNFEGKSWSEPRNIGYPVNTTGDDVFYIVNNNCKTATYSIINKDSGTSDIFKVEIKEQLAIP